MSRTQRVRDLLKSTFFDRTVMELCIDLRIPLDERKFVSSLLIDLREAGDVEVERRTCTVTGRTVNSYRWCGVRDRSAKAKAPKEPKAKPRKASKAKTAKQKTKAKTESDPNAEYREFHRRMHEEEMERQSAEREARARAEKRERDRMRAEQEARRRAEENARQRQRMGYGERLAFERDQAHKVIFEMTGERPTNAIELKRAYRKGSLMHHPDVGGTQENFVKLNKAYETLKLYLK